MDHKLERKQLRKAFSPLGWALLIYLLLLNAFVTIGAMVDVFLISLREMNGEILSMEQREQILMNNGWGYLVTIAVGLVALRVWKGKQFCSQTLWTRGRPMKLGDFLCLTCLFLAGQAAFQILALVQESILNQFGLSALSSIESATMSPSSLSMFLYACIGAPVAEEILFRGLVLRQLEPYGKRFAIVMSAFAFAVFHGNLVQIPYTFLVGLVLGYVAVEYNILWAMVLHMINNLVLGDMIERLTAGLGSDVTNGILVVIIYLSALSAMVILPFRGKEIREYHRENPIRDDHMAAFFTSPGIIAVIVSTLIALAAPLVGQIVDNMGMGTG